MSLNQICCNICNKLEHAKKFNKIQSIEDRIKYCYDICDSYLENLNIKRTYKSREKYEDLRARANYTFYTENEPLEGLKLINECIANAGSNSDLINGYKDRSSILFSFGLDESLCDEGDEAEFREAPKMPLPQPYLIGSGNLPLYIFQSSGCEKFLESATSFGLKYSDFWERQLVAENDIKTGEVVIIERPYASVLLPNHYYTHCSHCYQRCLKLLPCEKCCFAMFCSENCREESLLSYHFIECNIIDILVELKIERMELLALRILICAANKGKDMVELCQIVGLLESRKSDSRTDCPFKANFNNIYNLITNSEKRSASDLFYRCVVSAVLIHILAKYTEFFKFIPKEKEEFYKLFCVSLIFHFMQSLPCNAHEISEMTQDGLSEIGAGIYATLSLINHSCDPNVVRYSCRNVIVLKAIKPIKQGEQIFDNYGYHYATHSLSERQDSLMNQYYFKCKCEACTQVWPKYEDLPKENVKFKKEADLKTYKQLTKLFEMNMKKTIEGNFDDRTVQQHARYLDFLHEFVELPWQYFNNCQEALKHCWNFEGNYCTRTKGIIC